MCGVARRRCVTCLVHVQGVLVLGGVHVLLGHMLQPDLVCCFLVPVIGSELKEE